MNDKALKEQYRRAAAFERKNKVGSMVEYKGQQATVESAAWVNSSKRAVVQLSVFGVVWCDLVRAVQEPEFMPEKAAKDAADIAIITIQAMAETVQNKYGVQARNDFYKLVEGKIYAMSKLWNPGDED